MNRGSLILVALACTLFGIGCSSQLKLDPEFAARADELPVTGASSPPARFTMGGYRVSSTMNADSTYTFHLLGAELNSDGDWRMHGTVDGQDIRGGGFECTGPNDPPVDPNRTSRMTLGSMKPTRCEVHDGTRKWSMRLDITLSDKGPGVPNRPESTPGESDNPRAWDAVLQGEGQSLQVEWVRGTSIVRTGSSKKGGYYVVANKRIVAAMDIGDIDAPRVYVARDAPAELRPTIAAALATTYSLVSADKHGKHIE